jgi:archaeal type IV pilus assembly protein PilA
MHKKNKNDDAVSAVIGVTLMVAITIAMAAVAFAYFTGMIGGQTESAPTISFNPNIVDKTITIDTADSEINWQDITITASDGTNHVTIPMSGTVTAGDIINLRSQGVSGTVDVTITHIPSNTLLATYTFSDV